MRRYSLEEFWDLPAPAQGGHYELIAGVLYKVPPPSEAHDVAVSRLAMRVAAYLVGRPALGDLFFPRAAIWVMEGTQLEPDLMYVSKERQASESPGRRRSADLVIEVLSTSSAIYDRQMKSDTYAALGVRELWLVDLSRHEIEQRVLEAGAWRVQAAAKPGEDFLALVLPGLRVEVGEIFEGLPRD